MKELVGKKSRQKEKSEVKVHCTIVNHWKSKLHHGLSLP